MLLGLVFRNLVAIAGGSVFLSLSLIFLLFLEGVESLSHEGRIEKVRVTKIRKITDQRSNVRVSASREELLKELRGKYERGEISEEAYKRLKKMLLEDTS